MSVDSDDGGSPTQGLVRFDDIFGPNVGQIPLGATITAATLSIRSTLAGAQSTDTFRIHQMLIDWDENTTWNSIVGGVLADDIDAKLLADDAYIPMGPVPFTVTLNVIDSLQAWSDGTANYGWVILPSGPDGTSFSSSEGVTVDERPLLAVSFVFIPEPTTGILAFWGGISLGMRRSRREASLRIGTKQDFA